MGQAVSKVVVIGNAGLDLGLAVPHLPAPGETLVGTPSPRMPGGKGLNQAVVAARCGARVTFCAPLGNDEGEAREIEAHLAREQFDRLILPRLPHPTDFSLLMVLPTAENAIVSTSACSLALTFDAVAPALRGLTQDDVVLVQGNLSLDTTGAILAAAPRSLFNPAPVWPGAETLARRASIVVANEVEARALGRVEPTIVTLGAEGCRWRGRTFPAERVAAIDTTGCGDTFCGVLAALLAQGLPMERAIGAAQKAAALTATRPGAFAALPSRAELESITLAA
jgi:ribokinase